jgi:toxin ParE1/3/4
VRRFILTDPAGRDMHEIEDYISLRNPGAGRKIIQAFVDKFEFLLENPFIHPAQEKFRNLRKSRIGRYLIFYRTLEVEDCIEIVRVLHGARDIETIMKKPH